MLCKNFAAKNRHSTETLRPENQNAPTKNRRPERAAAVILFYRERKMPLINMAAMHTGAM